MSTTEISHRFELFFGLLFLVTMIFTICHNEAWRTQYRRSSISVLIVAVSGYWACRAAQAHMQGKGVDTIGDLVMSIAFLVRLYVFNTKTIFEGGQEKSHADKSSNDRQLVTKSGQ